MSFQSHLKEAIVVEATKLIRRHQRYGREIHDELRRIQRRSGVIHEKKFLRPTYWTINRGFDPYFVRSNASAYAVAIDQQLQEQRYQPRPAVLFEVPKADGTLRGISVFQVADNALSRMVYKNLISKNSPRFSARCYAYRTDITLHDAVQHIFAQFRRDSRLFIAEFDYSKFFDSLDHGFLSRLIDDRRFLLTQRERRIIRAFMMTPSLSQDEYDIQRVSPRTIGIPQGTSISLFLANAAGSFLDERLEHAGVGFARYADDTLVWSTDYANILGAAQTLGDIGREVGVRINMGKSEGVSILTRAGEHAEFREKTAVKFVGYEISRNNIRMSESNVRKAKNRISNLIYRNLLQPVVDDNLLPERVNGAFDRDYYIMMMQIRRYLYGGLSEKQLRAFSGRAAARIHFKGLMSFYPIVDDENQLKQLDGWMLHTVFTTLRRRRNYLQQRGLPTPEPFNRRKEELCTLVIPQGKTFIDLRLPSFLRMSRLVFRMAKLFGANSVANVRPTPYYDE